MNALKSPLFYIILLAVLLKAHGRRNFEIRLESCNCTSNSIFAEPCDCHIDKTFDPPKAFFDLQMHKEIIKANFSFEVFALRKDSTYVLFSSTGMDFCMFGNVKAKLQLPMVKIFREMLLKFGKLPEKCPIEKDFHYLFKEMLLDAEQFPPYVPETRFLVTFNVTTPNYMVFFFDAYGDVVQKSKSRWG